MPDARHRLEGCNGRAQRLPCQDGGYYPAHLAFSQTSTVALPFKGSGSSFLLQMPSVPVAVGAPNIHQEQLQAHEALP